MKHLRKGTLFVEKGRHIPGRLFAFAGGTTKPNEFATFIQHNMYIHLPVAVVREWRLMIPFERRQIKAGYKPQHMRDE